MLAKLTEPIDHANWVQKLSEVEFAMNNTIHASTKQIPSIMLFGVETTEYLHETYANEQVDHDSVRARALESIQKSLA